MPEHRVVVTGLGVISPIGLTVADFWQSLVSGKNGIGPITLFDTEKFAVKVAAEVRDFDPANYMPLKRADRTARCTHFAMAATRMALEHANLDMGLEDPRRVGVCVGTAGTIRLVDEQGEVLRRRGPSRVDPLLISKMSAHMVPVQIGLDIGAKGPNTSVASACASGSDAIGRAMNHVRWGQADVMITGGAEAQISPICIAATDIVGALTRNPDPETACRPFDKDRDGFVFAEGAAILVLESLEHAQKRGAPILAELAGAGWSFDAFSETAPDAQLQAHAMQLALDDASVSPQDVDHINAHATSTQLNDVAETKAIKMVLGEKRAYEVPLTANKSMLGHLACAAGSVEAVAAVLTLQNGVIPPTINYRTPDPECDLDCVPNQARRQEVSICLSNSFGLGGQNCSLVFKKMS